MEIQEPESFENLFDDVSYLLDARQLFPTVERCFAVSSNETELMQAVKISFEFGLKTFSVDEFEEKVFQGACSTAKKLLINKLQRSESIGSDGSVQNRNPSYCQLTSCSEIVSQLIGVYVQLKDIEKMNILQVESLLVNSAEILYVGFGHCSSSEKIYGSSFNSLTEYLTHYFKKCCELQELLISLVMEKLTWTLDDNREIKILANLLMYLSKSGIVLMNLDAKTMAKVWKTYVCIAEKYFEYLKEELDVGATITSLCESILMTIENVAGENQNFQELNRTVKLACFNMKLMIKFCELFSGFLCNCQKSILNLLVTLSRFTLVTSDKNDNSASGDILKQLTLGAEPLLSHLLSDVKLVKEFTSLSRDIQSTKYQTDSFALLCCLVLKKLIDSDKIKRDRWFNEEDNILQCLFLCLTSDPYGMSLSKQLPTCIVDGKSKKYSDLYEYILITVSSFVFTSTSHEFTLVEKTLLRNVLQPEPLCALLAIDIWCLLARFSRSELCLTHVMELNNILQQFNSETLRVEKCYLMLLVQRLFRLLTQSQRAVFIKSTSQTFASSLWKTTNAHSSQNNELDVYLMYALNSSFAKKMETFLQEDGSTQMSFDMEPDFLASRNMSDDGMVQRQVSQLWRFNTTSLTSYHFKEVFMKINCLFTVSVLSGISSENLLLVVSKMEKLLRRDDSIALRMYFNKLLAALSVVTFPSDNFQEAVIEGVAKIFTVLLSSENVLVRQRAMENFYDFSHRTSHTKIISLSVQNSPALKCQMTDYFQKKLPSSAIVDEWRDHVRNLCRSQFQHKCSESGGNFKRGQSNGFQSLTVNGSASESVHQSTIFNSDEIINRWKNDGETIILSLNLLTNSQKAQVRRICSSLLDVL